MNATRPNGDRELEELLARAAGPDLPVDSVELLQAARTEDRRRRRTSVGAVVATGSMVVFLVVAAFTGLSGVVVGPSVVAGDVPTTDDAVDGLVTATAGPVDVAGWSELPVPGLGTGGLVHAARLDGGDVLVVRETAPSSGELAAAVWDSEHETWDRIPDPPLALGEGSPISLELGRHDPLRDPAGVLTYQLAGPLEHVATVEYDKALSARILQHADREGFWAPRTNSPDSSTEAGSRRQAPDLIQGISEVPGVEAVRSRQLAGIDEPTLESAMAVVDLEGERVREEYFEQRPSDSVGVWFDAHTGTWHNIPSKWNGQASTGTGITRVGQSIVVPVVSRDHTGPQSELVGLQVLAAGGTSTRIEIPDQLAGSQAHVRAVDDRRVGIVSRNGTTVGLFEPKTGTWNMLPETPDPVAELAPIGDTVAVTTIDNHPDLDNEQHRVHVLRDGAWIPSEAVPSAASTVVASKAGMVALTWDNHTPPGIDQGWVLNDVGWTQIEAPTGLTDSAFRPSLTRSSGGLATKEAPNDSMSPTVRVWVHASPFP